MFVCLLKKSTKIIVGRIGRRTSSHCFRICLGLDSRNWNRILGFRLASPRLRLLLRLLLLLRVHLLRPSLPRSSPAAWRRSRGFSFITSPPWRESLVRELIGECRRRELAIPTRTANVCRSFGFQESLGWENCFQTLFSREKGKKKHEFILYIWFVIFLI